MSGTPYDDFSEIDFTVFFPGKTLRASTVQQINDNILEATYVPEVFAKANYTHGSTVALPTGADGYSYSREEIVCLWWFANTGPETVIRLALFGAWIDQSTGEVTIETVRVAPGGGTAPAILHEGSIDVVVIGFRGASFPNILTTDGEEASGGSANEPTGDNPADATDITEIFETPSGTINGTDGTDGNAAFTISQTPFSHVQVTKNGQELYDGVGYTISSLTITFASGYIPIAGDLIRARYWVRT